MSETLRTVSLRELYRAVLHHAHGLRARFAGALTLLTGSQLLKLATPWMAAQAIDAIQSHGTKGLPFALPWIVAVMALMAGSWLLHGPARVIERNVGLQVRRNLADALYAKLAKAPLAWHEQHHSAELQHRVAQASRALSEFTQNQFVYLQNGVNLLGPLVALTLLSTFAGGVALAGYLAIGAAIVMFDGALMRLADLENRAERRYAARLLDALGNVASLLSLRLQPAARRGLNDRLAEVFEPLGRSIVINEWKWCLVDLLGVALSWGLVTAYAWHAGRSASGTVMLGSLFMVFQYAQQAAGVVGAMASHFQSFSRTRTDFASADLVWHAPESPPPALPLSPWLHIEVNGLSYSRPGAVHGSRGPRGQLHELNLTLHRGERIALVGASGSGKTTLLRVLAGLYEADTGELWVDGHPVDLAHLGASATLIPQDAEMFEASVRENLAFGTPVSEASLRTALHVSACQTVVDGLPNGLDTVLGERGANLSGGQRQRVALARGVLAAMTRPLLLLDEPTSALDPLTEREVHERLREAFPNACIVASVHRMSLLSHFDRVVFMMDGRLIDCGAPDDVAGRQPEFARMLRSAPEEAAFRHASAV